MSTFTFNYVPDPNLATPEVAARVTGTEYLPDVIAAFEQFLLGVTFQPESIRKYIDMERVHDDQEQLRT